MLHTELHNILIKASFNTERLLYDLQDESDLFFHACCVIFTPLINTQRYSLASIMIIYFSVSVKYTVIKMT